MKYWTELHPVALEQERVWTSPGDDNRYWIGKRHLSRSGACKKISSLFIDSIIFELPCSSLTCLPIPYIFNVYEKNDGKTLLHGVKNLHLSKNPYHLEFHVDCNSGFKYRYWDRKMQSFNNYKHFLFGKDWNLFLRVFVIDRDSSFRYDT